MAVENCIGEKSIFLGQNQVFIAKRRFENDWLTENEDLW